MNEISDFIALQSSENTKEGYARVLGRFLIYCNGSLPTGNAWVDNYIKNLKSAHLSNRSINWHITILKTFYKKALDKVIYFDRLHTSPPEISSPTPEVISKLFSAASKEFEPVLRFFVDSGLRVNEFKLLSEQKFNIIPKEFIVMGKGKKQRVVVVSPATESLLKTPYLFSRPWTIRQVQYQLRALAKKIGIPHLHPHQLRHYFATTALNNGVNILEIKEMLGHAFLQTTEVYTHVTQGRLREVWKKYHSII
jgi:integrase/recombinase XerD